MASRVSLVKSKNSYDGVLAALKPLEKEIASKIKKAKRPIIKVNFVSTYRELAATPVEAVRATLDFLKPLYKDRILIVEGATLGETFEGFKNFGYLSLEDQFNVRLFDLNEDQASPVKLHNREGKPFNLPLANTVKDSDFIISVCRAKTHDTVIATLTLKNLVVGALHQRSKVHQGKMIHRNLCDLAKVIKPSLAILDGTVGMEGNGPTAGTEIHSGWIAAGLDFLAVDTLSLYLMGFELDNVGYLKLCQEEGLGNAYPKDVKVIGEDPEKLKKNFKPHSTHSSQIHWK